MRTRRFGFYLLLNGNKLRIIPSTTAIGVFFSSVMVLAGTSVLLVGCGGTPFQALPVQETAVKKVEFTEDIQTVSTLEAKDLVALAAQAGGRIDELKIAQGDLVKAGQLLLVLDQEQENARLRSEVAKAETDKLNYQRYEYLASKALSPRCSAINAVRLTSPQGSEPFPSRPPLATAISPRPWRGSSLM